MWLLYQIVSQENGVSNSLGAAAGKCFAPYLLPGESQALALAGHPQALLSSRRAAAGQMRRGSGAQRSVLAALGFQWKNAVSVAQALTIPVPWDAAALRISYKAHTVICSLNEGRADKFLGLWEGANQPWVTWEGTEELLGVFKSESGGDEHFLPYDGGLADQKLIDVQQWQLFCLWNWTVPGLTVFGWETIRGAGHNLLTAV